MTKETATALPSADSGLIAECVRLREVNAALRLVLHDVALQRELVATCTAIAKAEAHKKTPTTKGRRPR